MLNRKFCLTIYGVTSPDIISVATTRNLICPWLSKCATWAVEEFASMFRKMDNRTSRARITVVAKSS